MSHIYNPKDEIERIFADYLRKVELLDQKYKSTSQGAAAATARPAGTAGPVRVGLPPKACPAARAQVITLRSRTTTTGSSYA